MQKYKMVSGALVRADGPGDTTAAIDNTKTSPMPMAPEMNAAPKPMMKKAKPAAAPMMKPEDMPEYMERRIDEMNAKKKEPKKSGQNWYGGGGSADLATR